MIINSKNETEVQKGRKRFKWLIDNGKTFELTQKRKKRTYKQNRYLHLILGWFGLEVGYTLPESKIIYKKLSPEIFEYEKNEQEFLRSSAELNTKQMSITIERFRNYSNDKAGIYLPEANETAYLNHIEQELNKYQSKVYL